MQTAYEKAQAELRDLQDRLEALQREHPIGNEGVHQGWIRNPIARLNEELGAYEGSEEVRSSPSS